MTPRLAILSGGRAGTVEPIRGAVASIGRHPTCQIRLDADQDTEVSNRHAIIQQRDSVWIVRDLGSMQGTYLNGQRIAEEQPLNDGDLLRLGATGPEVQFLLSDRAEVAEPSREPTQAQPAKPIMGADELERILAEEQAGQLARDAAAAARKRRLLQIVGGVAVLVAVVVAGILFWQRREARRVQEEARLLMLSQADSMMASVAAIDVASPFMRTSLDSARTAATRLRASLADAGPNAVASSSIMKSLDSAISRERDIADAAEFNPEAAATSSAPAVGLVIAQYADGSTALATGFAIRRDGTGGVLLTTKGVVLNAAGESPVQLAVLMPGVAQPIAARVLKTHMVEDIALLRVQQRGGIPVVQGLAWRTPPVAAGRPVALIGYPPPIEIPARNDWRSFNLASTTTTGTVALITTGFLTVDGWGTPVSAGSPVIDDEGLVAGIVSSAAPSAGGRLYDAVPVVFALELLDQLQ
ncbi:MAG: FHA domain-containing protein [Gemmatimonadales bacterium]